MSKIVSLLFLPFLFCLSVANAQEFDVFTSQFGITSDAYKSLLENVDEFSKLRDLNSQVAAREIMDLVDPRIVGGNPTDISNVPWQVATVFQAVPEPTRLLNCGGTAIAAHWVLTAAHCFDDGTKQDVVSQSTFFSALGIRTTVAQVFIHPQWNANTQENDITLLKVVDEIPAANIIAFNTEAADIPAGTRLMISGWGAIFEGGPISQVLRLVEVPVVAKADCNATGSYGGRIKPTMLCAGEREGGLDSCQGDSGGPAVAMRNGVPLLVGVVSWGEGCARRLKYGVYTSVGYFASWITETMDANS